MGIQSTGVGSNLNVNDIITKLMQVESQPLTSLAKKEASYLAKLTAYGTLNGALSSFQSSFVGLNSTAAFQNLTANVGDATILSASTTSVATAGNYNINVTQLAKAQTISSAGQVSTTNTIGTGATSTISFQFGTISGGTLSSGVYSGATFTQDANQAIGTVTIDSSNNSLQGIRDAINAAAKGVTASIVGDGSATPYHLVLSSNKTGLTSSLKIDVTGDATLQSLLNYNPAGTQNLTETTTGQNANLTINGISITSTSNTVNDAVQGTAITLAKVGSTTLALSNNTAGVQNAISTFVKGYNDLQSTFKSLTGFDSSTKKGGVLTGDAAARGAQTQVRNALSSAVNGLGGNITTLSSIGISFQKDGTLSVDSTKLQAAINNNFKEISGLFATIGKATDSLVSYSTATSATTQGSYALNVSALATQGSLTGDLDLTAGSTTIDPSTSINVTIDGTSAAVSLAAGTYTSSQLTTLLQTSINGTTAFSNAGIKISAATTGGGFLKLTSNSYGSTSNIALTNGTGTTISALTGTIFSGNAGTNVTGSFNGVSAVGAGQFLTGTAGSAADGLKVVIAGGSTGDRGTVHFSKGYASQLSSLFSSIVGSGGSIASTTDGVNRSIKDIGKQRDILNSRLIDTEARYRAQFTALDRIVSGLNNTSTFLTQQLSALTGSSSK
ncbi:flagellar filament capping protein FliD [Undibacterium flavidum]|uniref:Flagellar hook-associated protein 2 n=1 Tax=Undibacterium flavidum TaxID=2762297 RepID=A0ABR6Y6Q4_9BURK|nr:flagellar filament capping protein FliD [Undibacterium flavidum]MBC3872300.1 flagellar filament capping protein FliD [Undibacterium flavidum]